MNKSAVPNKLFILGLIIFIATLVTGCGIGAEKARKPSQDFSRGLPLLAEANSSPAVQVEPSGQLIQVIVPYENEEGLVVFRYIQLNSKAEIVLDQDLLYTFGEFARSPIMVSIGDYLHLVWAARESTIEGWQLWYAMVNQKGEITIPPKWISQDTDRVSQFDMSGDGAGGAVILWEDSDSDNIIYSQLSAAGSIISPAKVLISQGEKPAINLANDGSLNLVWMEDDNIYYGRLNDNSILPLQGDRLIDRYVAPGNRMDGPIIGSTRDHIFIFWSVLRQTGLEAGTAITEYLVFSTQKPSQFQRGLVTAYSESEDLLQPYQGDLSISEIVSPPREDYLSTNYIYEPHSSASIERSLTVVVSADQTNRLDDFVQILVGVFDDGEYQGYTLATKTRTISQKPNISVDNNGHIHLIWQDGSAGNWIYYATTAPDAKANLDRVSFSDIPTLILSGGLEAITGILLFPFAFPWMAVGLVMLIVWRLARNEEDVTQHSSRIILVLALISYQVSKLLFLPDMLVYVPFSAWLDFSAGTSSFLRIAVPLIIFGIGIGIAEWIRRRRVSPPSTLMYFVYIILVDTILTLAIYGVIFLGEY